MATKTEAIYLADVLLMEGRDRYSRESKVIAASQTLAVGSVCQRDSANRMVLLTAEADEVQTIGITGTLTAGSFVLTFVNADGQEVTTDPIAYNAITSAIQTGVDTALGASAVTVGGTAITAMTFTFDGNEYTNLPQSMIEVNGADLTGEADITVTRTTGGGQGVQDGIDCVQTVTIGGTLTAGTFTLTFTDDNGDSAVTTALAYNANAAAIEAAIDVALGANSVTVAGTVASFTITFDGPDYDERAQDLVILDITSLTGEDGTSAPAMTTAGFPAHTTEAEAICLAAKTTVSGEVTTETIFLVRHAAVNQDRLDFNSGNMARAIEALAKAGIVMRRQPQKTSTQTT